ncbi:MAG: phage portal protein [Thermosynechococcaceae cyanobacterium MS004]|nr:phage portal protein [Thermosynechococcaceae cyanobacterium MS004]
MSKKKAAKPAPRPKAAGKAGKPKRRRGYDGARSDRLTADWATPSTPADGFSGSLQVLRNRSRDLARNFDIVNGLYTTMPNNIIGTGMTFQAKVLKGDGQKDLDDKLNARIEEEFRWWCEARNCHTGGQLSFADIEYIIWRSVIEAGEIFVRFIPQAFGESQIPLGLEILEAEQLAEDYFVAAKDGQNAIFNGIEMDQWGRPVAYWFWPNNPSDWRMVRSATGLKAFRVPANEVLHIYRSLRPNQHRGVPWLYCSLITMQHIRRYIEGEVVAARLQNAIAGFIKRPESELPPNPNDEDDLNDEQNLEDIAPGAIEYLNPGEDFVGFAPNRPNSDAVAFIQEMQRGLSAGQGISFEGVSRNFSQTNYSSARAAKREEERTYKIHQAASIQQLETRVYKKWLDFAVLSGVVSIPKYELRKRFYQRHIWRPQGWDWVDPEKDIKASILALRAGLTSYSDVLGDRGQDVEEVWEMLAHETALAEKLNITLDNSLSGPGQSPDAPAAEKKRLVLPGTKEWRAG